MKILHIKIICSDKDSQRVSITFFFSERYNTKKEIDFLLLDKLNRVYSLWFLAGEDFPPLVKLKLNFVC